jgi:hypothetical protein
MERSDVDRCQRPAERLDSLDYRKIATLVRCLEILLMAIIRSNAGWEAYRIAPAREVSHDDCGVGGRFPQDQTVTSVLR